MGGEGRSATDDAALVRQVAAGSEDALATLYDRHVGPVFATAMHLSADRHVVEDVVQETFLALWNRAELFDPSVGSLAAWLNTIARNRTIDRLRSLGRRPRLVPIATIGQPGEPESAALERLAASSPVVGGGDPGRSPEAEIEAAELRTVILRALDEIPDDERRVIVLAYRDQLSQAEIADQLGWPLGTVKTRTRRALHRLRTVLTTETQTVPEELPAPEVPSGGAG